MANDQMSRNKTCLLISVILVTGVWNRPTFIGYAFIPCLYWLFQVIYFNSRAYDNTLTFLDLGVMVSLLRV